MFLGILEAILGILGAGPGCGSEGQVLSIPGLCWQLSRYFFRMYLPMTILFSPPSPSSSSSLAVFHWNF